MSSEILAHIEGLLEGWECDWDGIPNLSNNRQARIVELFRALDPVYIAKTLTSGKPSDRELIAKITELFH